MILSVPTRGLLPQSPLLSPGIPVHPRGICLPTPLPFERTIHHSHPLYKSLPQMQIRRYALCSYIQVYSQIFTFTESLLLYLIFILMLLSSLTMNACLLQTSLIQVFFITTCVCNQYQIWGVIKVKWCVGCSV